jgi:hypothetical protein
VQPSISQLPAPEHVARHPLPLQDMIIAPMSVAIAVHPPCGQLKVHAPAPLHSKLQLVLPTQSCVHAEAL